MMAAADLCAGIIVRSEVATGKYLELVEESGKKKRTACRRCRHARGSRGRRRGYSRSLC